MESVWQPIFIVPKPDEKVPVIFSRTPYNFNSWGDGEEQTRTAEKAYEVVQQGMLMLCKMSVEDISQKGNGIY